MEVDGPWALRNSHSGFAAKVHLDGLGFLNGMMVMLLRVDHVSFQVKD